MKLILGLLVFYIGCVSFAGTQYQCVGSGKLKSNPQLLHKKDLAENPQFSQTTTKVKLTVEKRSCSGQTKDEKLFAVLSDAPSEGADYEVYFHPFPNRPLKKNDSVYFRVVWSCDKKCREKTWSEVTEAEFSKEHSEQ
jgi:hypothetical protein